jgi:hypothetical protein
MMPCSLKADAANVSQCVQGRGRCAGFDAMPTTVVPAGVKGKLSRLKFVTISGLGMCPPVSIHDGLRHTPGRTDRDTV